MTFNIDASFAEMSQMGIDINSPPLPSHIITVYETVAKHFRERLPQYQETRAMGILSPSSVAVLARAIVHPYPYYYFNETTLPSCISEDTPTFRYMCQEIHRLYYNADKDGPSEEPTFNPYHPTFGLYEKAKTEESQKLLNEKDGSCQWIKTKIADHIWSLGRMKDESKRLKENANADLSSFVGKLKVQREICFWAQSVIAIIEDVFIIIEQLQTNRDVDLMFTDFYSYKRSFEWRRSFFQMSDIENHQSETIKDIVNRFRSKSDIDRDEQERQRNLPFQDEIYTLKSICEQIGILFGIEKKMRELDQKVDEHAFWQYFDFKKHDTLFGDARPEFQTLVSRSRPAGAAYQCLQELAQLRIEEHSIVNDYTWNIFPDEIKAYVASLCSGQR